ETGASRGQRRLRASPRISPTVRPNRGRNPMSQTRFRHARPGLSRLAATALLLTLMLATACGSSSATATATTGAEASVPTATDAPADPTPTTPPTPEATPTATAAATPEPTAAPTGPVAWTVETFVSGLEIPWEMRFLPDGRIF